MSYVERIKCLIEKDEIKEASINLFRDALEAVLGDKAAIAKIMLALAKSPFFLREQLFWTKMEMFLDGVYLDDDDCGKLRARLVEEGREGDNPRRLIECIDKVESDRKIGYLINATRCLLVGFIERPDFFRICHAITHTLEEDLVFLSEHIEESDLPYDMHVQGLCTTGLMDASIIGENQRYSFTPVAEMVDQFAVSYDNMARYPDPTQRALNIANPRQEVETIHTEAIDALLGIKEF